MLLFIDSKQTDKILAAGPRFQKVYFFSVVATNPTARLVLYLTQATYVPPLE